MGAVWLSATSHTRGRRKAVKLLVMILCTPLLCGTLRGVGTRGGPTTTRGLQPRRGLTCSMAGYGETCQVPGASRNEQSSHPWQRQAGSEEQSLADPCFVRIKLPPPIIFLDCVAAVLPDPRLHLQVLFRSSDFVLLSLALRPTNISDESPGGRIWDQAAFHLSHDNPVR